MQLNPKLKFDLQLFTADSSNVYRCRRTEKPPLRRSTSQDRSSSLPSAMTDAARVSASVLLYPWSQQPRTAAFASQRRRSLSQYKRNVPQVQKQNKMTIQVFEVFARALTYLVRWAGPLEVLLLFSTLLEVIAGWEMKWTTMSVHSTMNERACTVLPKGWRSQCSLQFGLTRGNLSNSRTSSFPSYKSYAVPSGCEKGNEVNAEAIVKE